MGTRKKINIEFGQIVLLRTDHSKRWKCLPQGACYLKDRPYVSLSAAKYLVSKKIKALGINTGGPDTLGSSLQVHHLLLEANIIIIESLCNLHQIDKDKCLFIALPLKIKNGTGSPVRAIALIRNSN